MLCFPRTLNHQQSRKHFICDWVSFFMSHKFQLDALWRTNVTLYSSSLFLAIFHDMEMFSFPFDSIHNIQSTFQLIWTKIAYESRKIMVFDFICFKYNNEIHWNPLKLSESVCFMCVSKEEKKARRKKWQNGWRKTIKKRPNRPTNRTLIRMSDL